MLTANEATDTADISIEDLQVRRIALPPKHPFGEGRHGFAMATHQSPFWIEE